MKGPLHRRLHALLYAAWQAERTDPRKIKQESLAADLGQNQRNISGYLNQKGAGTLDLDEAEIALRHVGLTLAEFMAGAPPAEPSESERLARDVMARPDLLAIVKDLLPLEGIALAVVRESLSLILERARRIEGSSTARRPEKTRAARTRSGRARHREARGHK